MAQLGCTAKNCIYNQSEYCCKGDIMVGGSEAHNTEGTCCESFRTGDREHVSNRAAGHPEKTISIDCEAVKCVYNTNYRCYADHVDIKGSNAATCKETACATFREK